MQVANIVVLKWIWSENVKAEPSGTPVSIASFREPDLAGSSAPAFGGSRQRSYTRKNVRGGRIRTNAFVQFPAFARTRLIRKTIPS